jgi:hypothetical protein
MKKSFFKENFKLGDTVVLKKSAFPEVDDRKITVGVIMDDSILSVEEEFVGPIVFEDISKKESIELRVEKLKQKEKSEELKIIKELNMYDKIFLKEDWKQILCRMDEGFEWDDDETKNIEDNIDEILYLDTYMEEDVVTYVQVAGLHFDYLPIDIIDTTKTRSFKRKISDILEEYYTSEGMCANDAIVKIARIVEEDR